MNRLSRLGLASIIAIQMLLVMPGAVGAGWRVLPTTGFVADPLHIILVNTIGGLWIRTDQNGDRFFVYQGVPVAEGDVIDAIALCYRAEPGTLITGIGLVEFLGVGASVGTAKHFDGTDLSSPSDVCYRSPVANYVPGGAVNLWLQLKFTFSGEGTIYLGMVAVHVK